MLVSATVHDNVVIIDISGRIDSNTCEEVESVLIEHAQQVDCRLLIDLQQVGYMSSAGLRTFLRCAKAIKVSNGRLVLSSMNENVFQIFELSGFTKLFEFADTRADGVGFLA
jgi:anti-anti-sigma factor